MVVDANLFKQVMRRFATGVMVLTVTADQEMHALTVNAVASVSLDPLLMLVCIEKSAHSHALLKRAGAFALNILSEDQRELGERFAYDREARRHPTELVQGTIAQTGALIFAESLGFLECRVRAEYKGGDHTIFLGEVVNAELKQTNKGPLLYYGSQWLGLPSGNL